MKVEKDLIVLLGQITCFSNVTKQLEYFKAFYTNSKRNIRLKIDSLDGYSHIQITTVHLQVPRVHTKVPGVHTKVPGFPLSGGGLLVTWRCF